MFNSPTTKLLVAVSEQVFEPMQVPILIGNEVFIVTQQDIRKIKDSRYISFRRLSNDNNIKKNENDININNANIFDAINNAFKLREEGTTAEQQNVEHLQEQLYMNNIASAPIQMQIDLEKQSFNNKPIMICTCNQCSNRSSLLHRCENKLRCRGVNTDSISSNFENDGNSCESLSAREQLKYMKECLNTTHI